MTFMSPHRAKQLQKRGLRDWITLLGRSSAGASVHSAGGVTASIVPACPGRSICNSVTYDDAAALAAALDALDEMYVDAGISAWTVWTPDDDADAIDILEAAGHRLDATPMAMSLRLDAFEPPDVGDLDWDTHPDPADLGRLNDLAYGLPPEALLSPGLTHPAPDVTLYQARVDGEVACILGTMDHPNEAPRRRRGSATPPSDLGFYFVATHPDRRGRGLATRLMTVALLDAIERGFETSSLQGSPMGQPIYRRMGYADDFPLRMYERRR